MWNINLTKPAQKDSKIALKSQYKNKINELLNVIKQNPFQNPPPYEKLQPPRDNKYSRRINKQHRIIRGNPAGLPLGLLLRPPSQQNQPQKNQANPEIP